MTYVLHENPSADASLFGGKAASLARLRDAGFPVPAFVVLTPGEGRREWSEVLSYIDLSLGKGPFAVRSSGLAEDGAAHSHAGQFLSLLNVRRSGLRKAAAEVVESANGPAIREYRRLNGLPEEGGIAVVVQRMVAADLAGVAFTADPVSGRRDRIVISATAGLADRLVSGEEDGVSIVLDKATGNPVQGDLGALMAAPTAQALVDLFRRVEDLHGHPQDIEWAIEDGVPYLVQSRPITTALRPEVAPEPQADAVVDDAETILDNSNIVESYPGMVTTLTYSFAAYAYARVYRTFLDVVGVPAPVIRESASILDNMLCRVDGRVYYNLVNWYRALALLPGFDRNSKAMETMMGVSEPLPKAWLDRVAATATRDPRWFGKARTGLRLGWRAIRLSADVKAFRRRMARSLAIGPEKVAAMPLSGLAAEYRAVEARLLDRWDAPLVNDFLCMAAFSGSRKLLERWAGPTGLDLHNDAMIGQGDIVSAEPARRIAAMGAMARGDAALVESLASGGPVDLTGHVELADAIKDYLDRFGDRCVQELKLESLPLREDPRTLHGAIAGAARNPQSAPHRVEDVDGRIARLFKDEPIKRRVVSLAVRYAKARVRDRENLRFERTLIFGHARRVLRAMGVRLHAVGAIDHPRDVFHLTVHELLGYVEGFGPTPDLKGLVDLRSKAFEASSRRADPPERMVARGPVHGGVETGEAVQAVRPEGETRTATGCCSGVVEGVARVVTDPSTQNLEPGEVMVARHTDPGWIAVFANAAAIVVERGSLLSHSAIVSRELGIPCVVGVKGATAWIATGDRVRVDGATGRVDILERTAA